jgi:serine/threonine protein kinase
VNRLNGRRVALKEVAVVEAGDAQQFLKEAQLHDKIKHQHIVNLLDYFHLPERQVFCFVTELCELGDLNNLIKERPRWVDLDAVRFGLLMCADVD